MIVIAIISILASIIIPNIGRARARARAQFSACQENMKALMNAITMFSIDHPISLESRDYQSYRFSTDSPEGILSGDPVPGSFVPDYIGNIPRCPAAGSNDINRGGGYMCYYDKRRCDRGVRDLWVITCDAGFGNGRHSIITGSIYCPRIYSCNGYQSGSGWSWRNCGGNTNCR
ncbi:MAG: hypothetical protein ACLFQV_10415 [Vulcanimicrobiota bacterium]